MTSSQTRHPTDQALSAYGLRRLDDASAASVSNHLMTRSDCRRRLAGMAPDRFLEGLGIAQRESDLPGPIMSSTAGLSLLAPGAAGSPTPPPVSTLPPGLADHADYEIIRELGRGGMGVVYLAQNTLMGRLEVLKVVSSHLINRGGTLERFLTEIRNAARLQHPNIVTAYSALRVGEGLVLAMEYAEGLDLGKIIEARGPLPLAHACNYVHQAALGLQHAHEHGLVHRDIKPSNLMLARQGDRAAIKVLDFGLAKVRSEQSVDGGLTHEGQMLGTPAYISPEQIRDARGADIRADIYSFGCTLYCLLTGGPPFQGTSLYDILQAHHSMEAMPLNLKRPDAPVELAALVAKMMAKEPKRRFQEPKEVAQALTPFFKARNLALKTPESTVSHAGQPSSDWLVPGYVPVPTHAVTDDTGLIAQPKRVVEPSTPELQRERLVDPREAEPSRDETPAIPPAWRPSALWPSLAVGVLVLALGLFIAWAAIVRVRVANGMIELVSLPRGAEVFVDGEEVAVTWPGGDKPAIISVAPGKHKVRVEKDGVTSSGDEVIVQPRGKEKLTVRFAPVAGSPEVKIKAEDHPAGTDLADALPASSVRVLVDEPVRSAAVSSPELLAFYDFNDGTATDRSGHGNHGTLSAKPPLFSAQGYQGGALSFDPRQKNLVTIPVDINPSVMPQITMGGWFITNSASLLQPLLSHDNNGFDRTLTIDKRGGGGLGWKTFTGSGVFGIAPVKSGQWTFVVMRHDQSTRKLTLDVDGRRVTTEALFGLGRPRARLGGRPDHDIWFDGRSDNVFIYRGVLDDDTIADIRARGEAAILSMVEPGKQAVARRSRPTDGLGAGPSSSKRDRTSARGFIAVPAAPIAAPFQSLFDGSDLRGWMFDKCDARMWRVQNHTLVAINPDGRGRGARGLGRLLTVKSFKEFVFRFEYQGASDFDFAAVWWTLPGEIPPTFRPANSALGLGTNRGGGRYVSKGKRSELKGRDEWNVVEVEATDRLIRITVNGKETNRRVLHEKPAVSIALQATKPPGRFPRPGTDRRYGRVGFEVRKGGMGRFRNTEIKELPPSPAVKGSTSKPATKVEESHVEEMEAER